jgi:hypothetical protein
VSIGLDGCVGDVAAAGRLGGRYTSRSCFEKSSSPEYLEHRLSPIVFIIEFVEFIVDPGPVRSALSLRCESFGLSRSSTWIPLICSQPLLSIRLGEIARERGVEHPTMLNRRPRAGDHRTLGLSPSSGRPARHLCFALMAQVGLINPSSAAIPNSERQ